MTAGICDHHFHDMMRKLLRNEFTKSGKYGMPLIKKPNIDINKIELLGYNNISKNYDKDRHKTIHFFMDDYKFENVFDEPVTAARRLRPYYAVLSPNFSIYTDMPLAWQICSVFKNRWCGASLQCLNRNVIPTVEWGDERSFEFCFDGIEEGSVVAVSPYGKRKHKEAFMLGYNKMLEVIKPSAIICFDEPFPEMRGNIKVCKYNHSEWSDKLSPEEKTKNFFEKCNSSYR